MMKQGFPKSIKDIHHLPLIPKLQQDIDAGAYRHVPINFENLLYSEELVDLRDYGIAGKSFYHISDGSNPPYCRQLEGSISRLLARKSVADMLKEVNSRLEPLGLELFVWDSYRPIETQIGVWKFFEEAQRKERPSSSEQEIYAEVIKFVSDPRNFNEIDPSTWPTHMTGASVDLTIRDRKNLEPLDMGARFDQMDEMAFTGHFEGLLNCGKINSQDKRLLNRRLLYLAMTKSGFTNYPLEYWHYDWGNQMHQLIKGISRESTVEPAQYGVILES